MHAMRHYAQAAAILDASLVKSEAYDAYCAHTPKTHLRGGGPSLSILRVRARLPRLRRSAATCRSGCGSMQCNVIRVTTIRPYPPRLVPQISIIRTKDNVPALQLGFCCRLIGSQPSRSSCRDFVGHLAARGGRSEGVGVPAAAAVQNPACRL
jgi:hypothetical protein